MSQKRYRGVLTAQQARAMTRSELTAALRDGWLPPIAGGASTYITPSVIARVALATLYNTTVLAQLVWRDFDPDFRGKQGDTITVRKPAVFVANDFTRPTGIVLQDVVESSVPVKLDKLADVSFPVTSEDLTLRVDDFANRILTPAMEAIVQKVDKELATAIIDASDDTGGGGTVTWNGTLPSTLFTGETGARAKLGRAKLPTSERYAVFSPEAAGVTLKEELFVAADKSGWTDALREGALGRVFGFDTYESQVFGYGAGTPGQADGVAFHRTAVTLASRALQTPMGVAAGQVAVESYKGLTLRVVQDYDITQKQDVISVDFLYGIAKTRIEGAIKLNLSLGS